MKPYLLMAALLICQNAQAQKNDAQPTKPARFQLVQLGQARADQYLLDTETGRLWQIVVTKEGRNALQAVYYVWLGGRMYPIPETMEQFDNNQAVINIINGAQPSTNGGKPAQ